MQALSVIILAGGAGTRMCSKLPKVLHELGGKPLLQHVIDAVLPLNPAEIFVVYGHQGELVLKAMEHQKQVSWVFQKERLGTGHAVLQVLPSLKAHHQTLILCGDVPLVSTSTLKNLVAMTPANELGLLTEHFTQPFGLGRIIRNEQNEVRGIVEEKDASEAQKKITEINTGIYCVPTVKLQNWLPQLNNFNSQKEFYLTQIVNFACKENLRIHVAHPDKPREVCGVNTRIELAELERLYQQEQAQYLMLHGVTLVDPTRIDIRGTIIPAEDCVLDVGVILKGQVELAENCRIGAYCVLENVKLAPGTHIHPHSVIQGAEIGENCVIGPFARIRPGTRLAQGVHIGNFVELKNATVNEGSKANHLSYLGDTTIGKSVNIGAGVITCNYNGANKFETRIEDEVFVGSDVQLIAPVTLHKGATIGAGSTITKDAPAHELTLTRSKQIVIAGWKRPKK